MGGGLDKVRGWVPERLVTSPTAYPRDVSTNSYCKSEHDVSLGIRKRVVLSVEFVLPVEPSHTIATAESREHLKGCSSLGETSSR